MNKIDPSKKYTSRGKPVEFLHRAPEGWSLRYPWRGLVDGVVKTWTDKGRHVESMADPDNDLIEVREPLEVMVVVNCNGKPESVTSSTVKGWNTAFPQNAPHRLVKFREVIE